MVWLNPSPRGVTKRCRLSLLTKSILVYESQCGGDGGGGGGALANEYSCAHHVTWSPNKLWWISTSILTYALAYPSGEEGGNFLVQMIFTCRRTMRRGKGRGSAPCGRAPKRATATVWTPPPGRYRNPPPLLRQIPNGETMYRYLPYPLGWRGKA